MTATPANVTLAARVRPSTEVLALEGGGEAVLLDLAGERDFGLDPIGTRIWTLLAPAPVLQQVHASLCAEFDADPVRIEADLLALVRQLAEAGLVELVEQG